ncbi:unnamed protein product [Parnassius mnemosyne]|uniref:Endonuclease/exonuclease/phosphatase domain-containing protein n=1 Tax=Parnassius mnemosyne TaxID=213953 RepID=A0AAV1KLR3_9NEOP
MGDFNYGGVKWPLEDSGYLTPIENNFIQWYRYSNLQQLVDKHTRYREGNRPSYLDLVLTNEDSLIASIDHQAPIGKSDHTCLLATIELQTQNQQTQHKTRLNVNKADYDKINTKLLSMLPENMADKECVKSEFETLHGALMEANKFVRTTVGYPSK